MIARCALLSVLWFGLVPGAAGQALIDRINVELPRDYGYLVGDHIVQRISVTAGENFDLDQGSLPKPGRVDRWLWLQRAKVESTGATTDIELRYQLLTAPVEPHKIIVPEKSLIFENGNEKTSIIVEPFVFSALPLIQDGVEDSAFMTVQPALPPPALSVRPHWLGMAVGIASCVAGLGGLVYVFGAIPGLRRSHGPFARALKKISAAGRNGDYLGCARHLHHAFDATAGAVLLARDLPEFFAKHHEYSTLRVLIEAFYAESQDLFFGNGEPPAASRQKWRQMLELCRACRDVERGLGPAPSHLAAAKNGVRARSA